MAVAEGDLLVWVARLREASEVLHREVRWLGSDVSGPFSMVVRMAASDVWGGPFAEQLRGTIRSFDRQLVPWVEHLGRFQRALEEAAQGAELAARAEANGVAAPFDVLGVLARWRVWPPPPWPLDPGWAAPGGRPSTFVWVYPERARQLAVGLRQVAEQLRACRNRLANVLAPLGMDAPPGFEPLASCAEAVAAEVERRVVALEEADRRVAGSFGDLGVGLGFSSAGLVCGGGASARQSRAPPHLWASMTGPGGSRRSSTVSAGGSGTATTAAVTWSASPTPAGPGGSTATTRPTG